MSWTEERATVYVVDDEPAIRHSLEVLLRAVHLHVQTFASASEFLAAPITCPACLLLDIRMPEIDGFALYKRIAGTDHDLPVIVITGDGDEEIRRRSLEAGAVSFFRKPFDDEELLQAIYRAITRSPKSGD
ncbi:MAG: response regulator transcription factor [Vicinamibacteria bacterium]